MIRTPAIDPQLLSLLVCPQTGQALRLASAEEIEKILKLHPGSACNDVFLIRQDRSAAWPVRDGVPSLLRESQLDLAISKETN